MSPDIAVLIRQIIEFRDARDWKQFHTLKNLASALSVEAAELLELTQWKTPEELEKTRDKAALAERINLLS